MKYNLKKYFNKNNLIISSVIVSLLSVSSIGIFLSTLNNEAKIEVSNSSTKLYKKYFKERESNKDIFINRNIDWSEHRVESLKLLTNWNLSYVTDVKFQYNKIKNNLITFTKKVLQKEMKYKDIDKIYINVKFQIIDDKNLKLDLRWGDKKSIENGYDTKLYMCNTLITINN
ncbi:MAG: hypothetical protein ACRC4M_04245 [Mycoplasma sp.]